MTLSRLALVCLIGSLPAGLTHAQEGEPIATADEVGDADAVLEESVVEEGPQLVHPRRDGVRWAVFQRLVALLNPMGAEHTAAVGLRTSIGDQGDILFQGAHFGGGLINYFSPIYSIQGAYLRVSPLSFLAFQAELTQLGMWPIGLSGAGYYPLAGYDSSVQPQDLPAEDGEATSGFGFAFRTTLQGRVELARPVSLMIASELAIQYDEMGDAPFYYSMKYDLILAQRDWVLLNDAVINAEVRLVPDVFLSVGVYDNLRFVPASGYLAHQLGPILGVTFEEVTPEVEDLTIWVRGGYYTHHLIRADQLTILGGVALHYDLGQVR